MSSNFKSNTVRYWIPSALATLATILMSATIDPVGNLLRLQAMPAEARQRVVDNLQKFDVLYSSDQQQELRNFDRRLNELESDHQAKYLTALRRYHNWVNQLPETKQAELKEKLPSERMAFVKKLIGNYPLAQSGNLGVPQFMDVGDHSPIELAAIYEIWKGMSSSERQQVEKMAPGNRRTNLLKKAERRKSLEEMNRANADEEQWVATYKSWAEARRPALIKLLATEPGGAEILRRQAINFHYLEIKNEFKSVTPEHLAAFLGSFPPWVRSSFDHYPPDEARRRLTVVYRLVFPAGAEINAKPPKLAPPADQKSKPSSPRTAPNPNPPGKNAPGQANSPI